MSPVSIAPADGSFPPGTTIDAATPFGVYLHVPFCRVRCGYCDFNTYTSDELRGARQDQYADTLLREVALARGVLERTGPLRPASTVFFVPPVSWIVMVRNVSFSVTP